MLLNASICVKTAVTRGAGVVSVADVSGGGPGWLGSDCDKDDANDGCVTKGVFEQRPRRPGRQFWQVLPAFIQYADAYTRVTKLRGSSVQLCLQQLRMPSFLYLCSPKVL